MTEAIVAALLMAAQVFSIAARCQGEAEVLGYEGVRLCACSVKNRMDSPRFPGDLSVLEAYYAPDKGPADWAIDATQDAMDGYCEPVLYLYSAQDVRRLGLDGTRAQIILRRGRWALYGF